MDFQKYMELESGEEIVETTNNEELHVESTGDDLIHDPSEEINNKNWDEINNIMSQDSLQGVVVDDKEYVIDVDSSGNMRMISARDINEEEEEEEDIPIKDEEDDILNEQEDSEKEDSDRENILNEQEDSHDIVSEHILEKDSQDVLQEIVHQEESHDIVSEHILEKDSQDVLQEIVHQEDSNDVSDNSGDFPDIEEEDEEYKSSEHNIEEMENGDIIPNKYEWLDKALFNGLNEYEKKQQSQVNVENITKTSEPESESEPEVIEVKRNPPEPKKLVTKLEPESESEPEVIEVKRNPPEPKKLVTKLEPESESEPEVIEVKRNPPELINAKPQIEMRRIIFMMPNTNENIEPQKDNSNILEEFAESISDSYIREDENPNSQKNIDETKNSGGGMVMKIAKILIIICVVIIIISLLVMLYYKRSRFHKSQVPPLQESPNIESVSV